MASLVLLDFLRLPRSRPIKILDACAAPGNKASLILSGLQHLSQKARFVALDRDEKRFFIFDLIFFLHIW